MRKMTLLALCVLTLAAVAACASGGIETESIIMRKAVQDGNQYYLYVQYQAVIDGIQGTFEATVKLRNRAEYERYNVGDKYVFRRPAPK